MDKQPCAKCGSLILCATAERNDGLCAKCAKPKKKPVLIFIWLKALGLALLGCLLAYPTLGMALWNWSHVVTAEHWSQKIIPLAMFLVTGFLALVFTIVAPLAALGVLFAPVVAGVMVLVERRRKADRMGTASSPTEGDGSSATSLRSAPVPERPIRPVGTRMEIHGEGSGEATTMSSTEMAIMIPFMLIAILGFCRGMGFSFMSSPGWTAVTWLALVSSGLLWGAWHACNELRKGDRRWFSNFVAGPVTAAFLFGMFYGIGRCAAHLVG